GGGRPLDLDPEDLPGVQRRRRGDDEVPLADRLGARRPAVDGDRGDVEVDGVEGELVEGRGRRGGDGDVAVHAPGVRVPGEVELVVVDVVAPVADVRVVGIADARQRAGVRRR